MEALNAAFANEDELRSKLLKELIPGFWIRMRYYISKLLQRKLPLDEAIDQLLNLAKLKMREAITDCMMTLPFPPMSY